MLNALHTGGGLLITVMFIYFRYRSAVDSVHQWTVHTRNTLFESHWVPVLLTSAPHFGRFCIVKQKANEEV